MALSHYLAGFISCEIVHRGASPHFFKNLCLCVCALQLLSSLSRFSSFSRRWIVFLPCAADSVSFSQCIAIKIKWNSGWSTEISAFKWTAIYTKMATENFAHSLPSQWLVSPLTALRIYPSQCLSLGTGSENDGRRSLYGIAASFMGEWLHCFSCGCSAAVFCCDQTTVLFCLALCVNMYMTNCSTSSKLDVSQSGW